MFIDANVIVAFLDSAHEAHERAFSFFRSLAMDDVMLYVSPQVIGETFAAMTRPAYSDRPVSAAIFETLIRRILQNERILIISPGRDSVNHALRAATQKDVSASRIYDLLLYGTMREHGVSRIVTFNQKHFQNLDGIELVPIP